MLDPQQSDILLEIMHILMNKTKFSVHFVNLVSNISDKEYKTLLNLFLSFIIRSKENQHEDLTFNLDKIQRQSFAKTLLMYFRNKKGDFNKVKLTNSLDILVFIFRLLSNSKVITDIILSKNNKTFEEYDNFLFNIDLPLFSYTNLWIQSYLAWSQEEEVNKLYLDEFKNSEAFNEEIFTSIGCSSEEKVFEIPHLFKEILFKQEFTLRKMQFNQKSTIFQIWNL